MSWQLTEPTRFNGILGPLVVKLVAGIALVWMTPLRVHTNLQDNLRSGALLGLVDVVLYGASRVFGVIDAGSAVTRDLSTQFVSASKIVAMLEARVELLRETGRLLFLRGRVVQKGETIAASFSGTIRKPRRRS